MSKRPIEEQNPKQKPDLHLRKTLIHYQKHNHFQQEKKHLEAKINQKVIIPNRNTRLKENEVGHEKIKYQNQVLKDHLLLKKIT